MNAKERLEARNKLLDAYEKELGLPSSYSPGSEHELQEYLEMDRKELEALSTDAALSLSIRLSQYSFYLQRCLNREKANKTWAKKELDDVVAPESLQYDKYMKHEVKVPLICRANSAAKELSGILLYAEQRIDRLSNLSDGLKNLSYVISLIFKNKMRDTHERHSQ